MDYDYRKEKKILLVDDEKELLNMVQGILLGNGYTQIRTAGTVRQALKICRDWKPDLAGCDDAGWKRI